MLNIIRRMKVGQNSEILKTEHGSFVVVRVSRDRWRLGELMGDWLMGGSAEEVYSRAINGRSFPPIVDVREYQLFAGNGSGRPVRKATVVEFKDGVQVKFMERISKCYARQYAIDSRINHPDYYQKA